LFADDLKLLGSVEDSQDVSLIQRDMDEVGKWCQENKTKINIKKIIALIFQIKLIA